MCVTAIQMTCKAVSDSRFEGLCGSGGRGAGGRGRGSKRKAHKLAQNFRSRV